MSKRALVVGGSLAGLTTGILLLRQGWDVHVFERVADDMSSRGGGITTQDSMWHVFETVGLDVAHRPGVRLTRRVVFAADGSVLGERPLVEIVTSWDALYRLLHEAFPAERYHQDRSVESFEQDEAGVTITFEGGEQVHGDLLVAADGVGSSIRCQLLPDCQPRYANYVAWRGLVEERDLPDITRKELVDAFSFCLAPNEQMLSYTVPGPNGEEAPGERRHNFVWYRPADETHDLQDLLTDADGETHHPNIPAAKLRPEVVDELRQAADKLLSPAYAAYVRATEKPSIQPVNDHVSSHFAFGRVVLIGDAAAQARPHTGAGTSKAVEDAAALAHALAAEPDIPTALKRYEADRLPIVTKMVEHGRWLGRHLDPANGTGGEDQAVGTLLDISARARARETSQA